MKLSNTIFFLYLVKMLGFTEFIIITHVEILSSSPKYDMILIGTNHEYRESCNDRKVYGKKWKDH